MSAENRIIGVARCQDLLRRIQIHPALGPTVLRADDILEAAQDLGLKLPDETFRNLIKPGQRMRVRVDRQDLREALQSPQEARELIIWALEPFGGIV